MTATEVAPRGDFGRTPPHDIGAEQCTLGGMLLSAESIADVAETIRPEDHYRPAHQVIHEAILALWERGEPADPVTVADLLAKRGELSRVGGPNYLHTLIATVPTAANAGYYARIVRERAVVRRLVEVGSRIVQLGYEGSGEADELVDRAQAELAGVAAPVTGGDIGSLDALLIQVIDSLEGKQERGLAFPWSDLNELTNGMAAAELLVLAGRPGTGKSAAGLNIAAHVALRLGLPAVVFSMEMSREDLMLRLIAAEGRVPIMALMKRQLSPAHWERVEKARKKIMGSPLVIDDTPGLTLSHIRARLRAMARTQPAALAFVDYLQLMATPGRPENRQVAVAENTTGLKRIAGEWGIPVLAAAQLNRASAHRSDRRPELTDLRESGQIEQDATVVVLLHREDVNGQESPRAGEIDFHVAKNRNGPPATVTMAFQGEYSRCVDMAPSWTPSGVLREAS